MSLSRTIFSLIFLYPRYVNIFRKKNNSRGKIRMGAYTAREKIIISRIESSHHDSFITISGD
jgi:hypothetical protein